MISSRTEYDFVTIPDTIKINGEIMPRRTNKNELLGEDPSFLLEAEAERRVIWNGGTTTKSTMTREIEGARLQAIARSIREDVTEGRYIKPWPTGPLYDIDGDLASSLNLKYTVSDLASSPDDFTRGHPLVQSDVAKLFADTGLLRNCNLYQTWDNANFNHFSLTHSYNHGEEGGATADGWTADATTLYDYRCSCYEVEEVEGKYWYGSWREAVATGGTATLDFSRFNPKYIKPVTFVWAICDVAGYVRDWSSGEDSSTSMSHKAAFRVPSQMDGTNITLTISSLVSGAKAALSHYGFSKKFLQIEGNQNASVHLHTVLPIVEMNDRCRW